MKEINELNPDQYAGLIKILKSRFEKNPKRHPGIQWAAVEKKLEAAPGKLWSLYRMEETGGEPDVTGFDPATGEFIFTDCSTESPKGRRSLCYDREALNSRKEFKPANTALDMASEMGIEMLDEEQYRTLQLLGRFDTKTSSWIKTPDEIRKLGGAIFAEFRYNHVFIFHNSAPSYYGVRGFRGLLRV
jgi:hypothetical protein